MNISPSSKIREAVVAEKSIVEAGLSPQDAVFPFPQPFTPDCFNLEAVTALGADISGLVKTLNQVFLENIRNNFAAKVKRAVSENKPLPSIDDFNAVIAGYDFSGVRSSSSDEGLTALERIQYKIARRELRKLFRRGVFEIPELGITHGQPVTVAKQDEDPAAGQISFNDFESRVETLLEGEKTPWSGDPTYTTDAQGREVPANGAAIRDSILREADEEYARTQEKVTQTASGLKLMIDME